MVVARAAPLEFREWRPGIVLNRGPLGIPYPRDSTSRDPQAVLLPMAGFDAAGYRLGYGGGYFDRTLAALAARKLRPTVIGVAHEFARLETIHPRAHDIAMDYVLTERGVYRRDQGRLEFLSAPWRSDAHMHPTSPGAPLSSPVCYADSAQNQRMKDGAGND